MDLRKRISNNIYLYKFYHKLIKIDDQLKKNKYTRYTDDNRKELLSKEYETRTGQSLDWDNLQTYTEKLQWSKLFDRDPLKTKLTDKYLVREWITKKIGEQYLIPLLGVWDSFESINFEELPNSFVLKTNNASGTNIIVKEKKYMDVQRTNILFGRWLARDYSTVGGFQMQYQNINPKIIAEKYIVDSENQLNDYKFLCFNGKVYYCWVDFDRFSVHKRNIYDLDWNLQNWNQHNYGNSFENISKPDNFEEMVKIAGILCKGFSHVRVDLYNVDGKIYFGEMTFTSGNGFELINPHSMNVELGKLWELPIL